MQIDRLFKMVYMLLDREKITATELAEKFEVSVRTIYRDIDTLSGAGIPIYTLQGKGGGISLMDNFVLNKSVVSEEEQKKILLALQNLTPLENMEVGGALEKLGTFFKKNEQRWIEVDYSRWGSTRMDSEKFELLKTAILEKYKLSFLYFDKEGKSGERVIDPLKLVFKSRNWYLQGYCSSRKDFRTFKINRMMEVKMLDAHFTEEYETTPILDGPYGGTPAQAPVMKLRFSPNVKWRVYEEFDRSEIVDQEDGGCLVETRWEVDYWVKCNLLSFGAGLEVLEPESLRREVAEEARGLLEKNGEEL